MARKATSQLDFGLLILDPQEHARQARMKTRKCLACGEGFPSEHAGHRVCDGCKSLEAWRSANAASAALAGF
jgi:hypothetical protein